MSKQIYAININLSKFENNQIWQVAKSATASHLIYEKEMQFRKLANFVEVCNFAQHLWFFMLWKYFDDKTSVPGENFLHRKKTKEKDFDKNVRSSNSTVAPLAFVSGLGSRGHASAGILIITISILSRPRMSWNHTIHNVPLVYAYRQAMLLFGVCSGSFSNQIRYDIAHIATKMLVCRIFGCWLISIPPNCLFISARPPMNVRHGDR